PVYHVHMQPANHMHPGQPADRVLLEPEPRVVWTQPRAVRGHHHLGMPATAPDADGRTMFFNIYSPGITFAVSGPWRRRR
ncbi:MAG TPA: hypothetical protein VGD15_13180, partial [Kribbella sp.]